MPFVAISQISEMKVIGIPKIEYSELVSREIKDSNGDICAGIIILSDLTGLSYQSGNGIVKRNSISGKDFLFVSPDERIIEVYCVGFAPLKIVLNEIGIHLNSGQTWSLKISGEKISDLIPVNIIVIPEGASISVDGKNKSSNPSHQLTKGKHEVVVEKEGYKTIKNIIEVSSEKTLFNFNLIEVDIQVVTISSDPNRAKIFIDNIEKGETNKQLFLYPGEYSLRLSKSGFYDVVKKIDVSDNIKNVFSFSLEKNVGTLSIDLNPKGARLLINKENFTGKTEIELAPGRYKIEAEQDGYYPYSEMLEIINNRSMSKMISLILKTGGIQFSVMPINATMKLYRNNNIIQEWEGAKVLKNLAIGSYEIEISAKDYLTTRSSIVISENTVDKKEYTLNRVEYPPVTSESNSFVRLIEGMKNDSLRKVIIEKSKNDELVSNRISFGCGIGERDGIPITPFINMSIETSIQKNLLVGGTIAFVSSKENGQVPITGRDMNNGQSISADYHYGYSYSVMTLTSKCSYLLVNSKNIDIYIGALAGANIISATITDSSFTNVRNQMFPSSPFTVTSSVPTLSNGNVLFLGAFIGLSFPISGNLNGFIEGGYHIGYINMGIHFNNNIFGNNN